MMDEARGWQDIADDMKGQIERLTKERDALLAALAALVKSAKPCPTCAPQNDCYVFSMTALANAGGVLEQREPKEGKMTETPDWPPQGSAAGFPDGEQRYELFESKNGQWVRVRDLLR